MTIGRIKGEKTFGENRTFTGMDITAEYLNQKGKPARVTFHYAYNTNDLKGQVMRVLQAIFDGKPTPKNITNVETT